MWCSYKRKWTPNIVSMLIYNWGWQLPWTAKHEHITQTINGNKMFNKCFTMCFSNIDLINSSSPHTSYKHSHIYTRPKSKLQDSLHQFYGASLLLCSQKLNDHCSKHNESSSHPHFLKIQFYTSLPSMPGSSKQSVSNCPTTATSFLVCISVRPVYSYIVQQD